MKISLINSAILKIAEAGGVLYFSPCLKTGRSLPHPAIAQDVLQYLRAQKILVRQDESYQRYSLRPSYTADGKCHNAEPGTFNHECGRPAEFIGYKSTGYASGFCAACKQHGFEAKSCIAFLPVAGAAPK